MSAKYGYFRWLKEFKPKYFKFLMKDKGLGELLFRLHFNFQVEYTEKGGVVLPTKKDKISNTGQMSLFEDNSNISTEEDIDPLDIDNFDPDIIYNWVKTRPCKLEDVVKNKLS